MKRKFIFIIILLLLLTGCASVDYNLEIKKDLSIIETVNMSATKEYFSNYYMNLPITIVKRFYANEEWMKPVKDNNYLCELKKDNLPYPSILVSKKFESLEIWKNTTIYKNQTFNELNITKNNNLITINAKEFNKYYPDDSNGDIDSRYPVSNLFVKIKLPYVVTNSNADNIIKSTNTYIWRINEDTEDKEIKLTFNKDKIYIYNLSLIKALSKR